MLRRGSAGSDRDAIAVIGMSRRPPGAPSPDAYWELLREGRDAIIQTPADRWALFGLAGPDESTQGLSRGGYLDAVDRFDAGFFGISPREAATMDPQQRLMLELAWEALEDAGIPPDGLHDGEAGVYAGRSRATMPDCCGAPAPPSRGRPSPALSGA